MSYAEKLKDPRWQKKRLEILDRDEWTCKICKHKEITLHVHHKIYSKGNPWDIDSDCLVTLCEDCHESEQSSMKESIKEFTSIVKSAFFSKQIDDLTMGFLEASKRLSSDQLTKVLFRILYNKDLLEKLLVHVESEFSDTRYKTFITIDNNNI